MSKITVSIGSKDFDITLDEEFSKFFEEDFKETFGHKNNIETKELLWAYVQKSYDEYLNKKEYKKIADKIDEV
ncbi:hypothetical protein [Sulfurospirillum arcachonense]|uniref:hypothetical protein n=1 Tax=Sulfurospirillum arcachonense TaxID=57666 RepID=UPI00046A314B|nr:hypothetical protein [Sulfurospirillum arcachonense]